MNRHLLMKRSHRIFIACFLSFIILTTSWWWELWAIAGAGVALFRYRYYTVSEVKLALMSMLMLLIMFAFIWNVNTLLALNVQGRCCTNRQGRERLLKRAYEEEDTVPGTQLGSV